MREVLVHTLSNGIRIAHNRVASSKIVHCGIQLDIGSRDETIENQGIAHFWEHMAFKGTRQRNAYHILNRLEAVGGELNAFTEKEKICFYASLRNIYLERAIELLADITFNATFPDAQIGRERKVILEELAMYRDDPDDSLQDEFDAVVFAGHPLGMNILGCEKTLGRFRKKDLRDFIASHLDTTRVVVSVVGDVEMEEVVRVVEKYMGALPRLRTKNSRKPYTRYRPAEKQITRPVKQARCALGRTAYSLRDDKRGLFFMLTHLLGGPSLNSRLNMALREKHGLVYHVSAQFIPFTDTGVFVISFGTDPAQIGRSIDIVKNEMRKLREQPLGQKQLAAAKEQLLGQIAMAEESNLSFMLMMGRHLLDLGRIVPFDEMYARIRQTTPHSLQQMAIDMLDESQFSYLRITP
jgi:predicted Zn-dependent peptidase